MDEERQNIKEAFRKLGSDIENFAKSLEGSLKNVDLEKESVEAIRGTEKALDSLSGTLRKKREAMEKEGVKETFRKDGERIGKETSKGLEDIAEELEKAAQRLRRRG